MKMNTSSCVPSGPTKDYLHRYCMPRRGEVARQKSDVTPVSGSWRGQGSVPPPWCAKDPLCNAFLPPFGSNYEPVAMFRMLGNRSG